MDDIFGKALLNYYRGDHRNLYTIERDDGYAHSGSLKAYFARPPYVIERGLFKHVSGRVLDIGCGAGRHTLRLQKRGMSVKGIDYSPGAIEVCKKRGCTNVEVADIFTFPVPKKPYDSLLLLGSNMGIAETLTKAKKLFQHLRKFVKKGGKLVLTTEDVRVISDPVRNRAVKKNKKAGKPVGQWRIRVGYMGDFGEYFDWLYATPEELSDIAKSSGWKIIELIGKQEASYYGAVLEVV